MNAIQQARQAYAPNQAITRTDRSVEAQLISQITARLRNAANYPDLVSALHENRRMWMTMAADVADNANGLPKQLRAQLFYLAEFTETHTKLVLKNKVDATALVDINTAVLRGLNGQAAG